MTGLAAGVILLSTALALVYQWGFSAHDLAPDEAHYWDWSRRLAWSYYSKGPLVAWLIRASDELVGDWSVRLTGDRAAAVRLPAALCHAGLLTGWYLLGWRVFGSPGIALAGVLLSLGLPLVRMGAVLMTIDPPLLACWCWAVWGVVCAVQGRPVGWWIAAVATALGVLAKLTMLLLPLLIAAWLVCHHRRSSTLRGLLVVSAGAIAGLLPMVLWNAQHDWVTVRHVLGQVAAVGQPQVSRFHWKGPLLFIAGQCGTLFGLWIVAFLAAIWHFRPSRCPDPALRWLWWSSGPLWLFFAAVSIIKPGQPNWPAPAYVGGLLLATAWWHHRWQNMANRRLLVWAMGVNVAVGAAAVVLLHFPQLYRPLLARLLPPPSDREATPVRRLDLTARLAGWKALAAHIDQIRQQLTHPLSQPPIVCGTYWNQPGILRFYCQGHPETYTIGIPNRSDRHSQYDFWRPNPVADPQHFLGRTFIIVGDISPHLLPAFDHVEPPQRFIYRENGVPLQAWTIWIAHGFRGWDQIPPFAAAY
jgi:4-amino-4-deoxy-L-arabinose transferase-like glycosyltransferase